MTKDLTSSTVSRQNILNNHYALEKVELNLALGGTNWKDERTIDRYIEQNTEELSLNGYKIIKGQELKKLKENFGNAMNVATKTTILKKLVVGP